MTKCIRPTCASFMPENMFFFSLLNRLGLFPFRTFNIWFSSVDSKFKWKEEREKRNRINIQIQATDWGQITILIEHVNCSILWMKRQDPQFHRMIDVICVSFFNQYIFQFIYYDNIMIYSTVRMYRLPPLCRFIFT